MHLQPRLSCPRLWTLVLLVGLGAPGLCQAQIVNVSSLAGKAVKDGLSGSATLSVNYQQGNTQLMLAAVGATAFYRFCGNTFLLTADGAYGLNGPPGEWKSDPFRERTFEHLRYRRDVTEKVSWEGFVQHEYDRWRRLQLRALAGTGPRFDLDLSKDSHLAIGVAYMAQLEELLEPIDADPVGSHLEHRLSSYVSLSYKFNDRSAISGSGYFQPRLDAFSDLRALLDLALVVGITDQLGLTVTYLQSYDSAPPATVIGTEHKTTTGFTYAF